MNRRLQREPWKPQTVLRVLLAGCVLGYLFLLAGLFKGLLAVPEESDHLRIENAALLKENSDGSLQLRLTGGGFDDTVKAYLTFDVDNHDAILGSLKTFGFLNQVAVRGDRAYLANQYRGLLVLDVGDPRNPRIIKTVDTPGLAWGVCLAGDYAYVADDSAGLQVLSVADPENPRIVGSVAVPGRALAVGMLNDLAVVAGHSGVSVVDVDLPQRPAILQTMALDGMVWDVAISGERIYLANDRQGVTVLQFDLRRGLRLMETRETRGSAYSVSVSGRQLLVGCRGGVEIFAADSAGLRPLDVVNTPGTARGVATVEERIYVADNQYGLQIVERGSAGTLEIVKTIDTPGLAWGIAPANGLIYVADGKGGLQIVDDDRAVPGPLLRHLKIPGFAWGVARRGRHLYLAQGAQGVGIIDVTPSGELLRRAVVDTPGYVKRLVQADGLIYAAALTGGLKIINEKGPDGPWLEAGLALPGGAKAHSVAVGGSLACVAGGAEGLVIVDISQPGRPTVIGRLGNLGFVRDVAVVGEYAFLAAGKRGLLQVSIRNPADPQLVGKDFLPRHLQMFANSMDVAVSEGKLLVANARAGCQVFDVSEPDAPRFLASLASMSHITWVKAFGDEAIMFDYENGLQVIDLRNPVQPCVIGNLGASGQARGITVIDNQAYVSLGGGGLLVVPMPVRLPAVSARTAHELDLKVPRPTVPGKYLLNLVKGGERVVLEEALAF